MTAAIAALVVAKLVDTIRNAVDPGAVRAPKVTWNILAWVLGIIIALAWSLNLFPGDRLGGAAGEVLSGMVLGAGAGLAHEIMDALSGVAKRR